MSKITSLGLIGLGNLSTQFYIELLNNKYNAIHGRYTTCPFWLYNVDFNLINPYLPDEYEQFSSVLKDGVKQLENVGVRNLLIPNITIHKHLSQTTFNSNIYNPILLTIKKLKNSNIDTITILGSKYTMVSNDFIKLFNQNCIDVIPPSKTLIELCETIRNKVYNGAISIEEIDSLKALLIEMVTTTNFVVACTELSIALKDLAIKNLFDMVSIQVGAAIADNN